MRICVDSCVWESLSVRYSTASVWLSSKAKYCSRQASLVIKRSSDILQSNGWRCTTPYVSHSGFIKYWLHWKPLLRAKGPQTKSPFFFLSAFKGNVARQTFSSLIFPCHPLWTQPAPQYKEIYEITSCILAHTLAPMVSWYCKSNKILHIFHVVPAPLLNPTLHVSTRSHLWIKFDKTSKGCLWCLAFVTKCK